MGSQALRNTSRHGPKAAENHVRSVLKGHLSGYEVESGTGDLKKNHQVLMVFACFCRVPRVQLLRICFFVMKSLQWLAIFITVRIHWALADTSGGLSDVAACMLCAIFLLRD
jgi:hypothetical protein